MTVVLYGDFGNQKEFKPFHDKLVQLAKTGKIDYVVRHNTKVRNHMLSELDIDTRLFSLRQVKTVEKFV